MRFRTFISIAYIGFSSTFAFSGGSDEPYTRENSFEDFNNPNLAIQAEVNSALIKDLISESDWYISNYWGSSLDLGGKNFSTYVNDYLTENGRSGSIVKSTFLDDGGWSRCKGSEAQSGVINLLDIIVPDKNLSDAEVKGILLARYEVAKECASSRPNLRLSKISHLPDDWELYLNATYAWYKQDIHSTILFLEDLLEKTEPQSSIHQLSEYMIGRSYLIKAQENWISWEGKEGLDVEELEKARYFFETHFNEQRIYADSAYGLLGRIDYLLDDESAYIQNLSNRVALALDNRDTKWFSQIVREIFLTDKEPLFEKLLSEYVIENPQTLTDGPFANFLSFIHAHILYQSGSRPEAIPIFATLNYSAGFNYIMEYAKTTNDFQLERKAIDQYLDGNTKDLYLAELDYRSKGVSAFLQSRNSELVSNVAMAYCKPSSLAKDINSNLDAPHIFEAQKILYRSLIQRKDFETLYQLFNSPGYTLGEFELVRTAIKQAANNVALGKAYMNIGYFMEAKQSYLEYSGVVSYLENKYSDVFCKGGLLDNYRGPQFFYHLSIGKFSELEKNIDEAKALSFMINCDRPGMRGCWGSRPQDAESSEALFQRLHRKYPDTSWAENTPYYY
ncbi:hypothetical protein [Reinekea sp. G2M2-21]|uniref:hypothetical protein n=1 Tax=Reinekea sp. G2M2-21 TaxID=2788942 RepID=UPI0018AB90BF|nr:hypothetical protein [Reinekea sp. G2M2-21]